MSAWGRSSSLLPDAVDSAGPPTRRPIRYLSPMSDLSDDDCEDDAMSVTSFPPFSAGPSSVSSHTTHPQDDASMRSASPAPSVWSMTSSLRRQAYRHEYGRGLNNYSDIYSLPADDDEYERLDKQHEMFKVIMGKYPPPFDDVMRDNTPGEPKACLDLGCGSGSWIMEVAREYPNSSCVAVDLVPMQSTTMPPNCRSEVDDVNLGLEHFYGDFNVVHARLISSGIKDYHGLIEHISRVLRPGGLLDIMEFDFCGYDEHHKRIEPSVDGNIQAPWWPQWLAFLRDAAKNRGGAVDAATYLHDWVREHRRFENVVYREFWVPSSPFLSDPFWRQMGLCMREDILEFMRSGRPLLLGSGMPEALLNQIEQNAIRELMEARTPVYIRCQYVYATRKHPQPRA
ncbi:S-adenosyl-L-methionine-dependent methyltransferase [Schizophyllum commune]